MASRHKKRQEREASLKLESEIWSRILRDLDPSVECDIAELAKPGNNCMCKLQARALVGGGGHKMKIEIILQ